MTIVEIIHFDSFKGRIKEMKQLERKHKDKKHKIIVCENYIYCISKEELEYERY